MRRHRHRFFLKKHEAKSRSPWAPMPDVIFLPLLTSW